MTYHARVTADASNDDLQQLMQHTDDAAHRAVAEIQATARGGTPVRLVRAEPLRG